MKFRTDEGVLNLSAYATLYKPAPTHQPACPRGDCKPLTLLASDSEFESISVQSVSLYVSAANMCDGSLSPDGRDTAD